MSPGGGHGAPTRESSPTPRPAAVATSLPSATAPGPVEMTLADVVPGELDPARLPTRRIDRAAVLVPVVEGGEPTWIALDADTGTWVVPELGGLEHTLVLDLSPDGTRVAYAQFQYLAPMKVFVRDLGTGRTSEVRYPIGDDCRLDGQAWAPDGARLGLVIGCVNLNEVHAQPNLAVRYWGRAIEVDLTSGEVTTVDELVDAAPCEAYPAYSPDGHLLAYGVSTPTTDIESPGCGVRVVDLATRDAHEWPDMHMTYGDPWQSADRVAVWSESPTVETDQTLLLDGGTGETVQFGPSWLIAEDGFLAGSALVTMTWDAQHSCPATMCTFDADTQTLRPWLTLPEGQAAGTPQVARDVVPAG